MTDFVTPPPLDPGDSVAIVAPSAGLAAEYPAVYRRGLDRLESKFDLEPVEYPTATASTESLRANPEARARDVEEAFTDPAIDGVIATIGGNDQIRVLRHLDTALLREHPTRFFGASDNTNIAMACWSAGVVTFYGGHVMTTFGAPGPLGDRQERWLRRALFADRIGPIEPAERFTDETVDWADPDALDRTPEMEPAPGWRFRGADRAVTGRLWGGCFEVVMLQLAADRHCPPIDALDGGVLLLETSEELPTPAILRRGLLAMGERGVLGAVDGVIVGRIKARSIDQARPAASDRARYRRQLRGTMARVIGAYNSDAPIVFGVDVGHTRPTVPVPIGGRVWIDPDRERLAFE